MKLASSRLIVESSACVLLVSAGCSSPLNRELQIGDSDPVPLEIVTPAEDRIDRQWQSPSVIAIDRSNWETTTVRVPIDGGRHQPIYTQNVVLLWDSSRQTGAYPTATTALETAPRSAMWPQLGELFLGPVSAAVDIAMFVPRAVVGPYPTSVVAGPMQPYDRSTALTGAAQADGEPGPVLVEDAEGE